MPAYRAGSPTGARTREKRDWANNRGQFGGIRGFLAGPGLFGGIGRVGFRDGEVTGTYGPEAAGGRRDRMWKVF